MLEVRRQLPETRPKKQAPHLKNLGKRRLPYSRSGHHLQLALREYSLPCWEALNLIRSVAPSDQAY